MVPGAESHAHEARGSGNGAGSRASGRYVAGSRATRLGFGPWDRFLVHGLGLGPWGQDPGHRARSQAHQ